MRFFSVITKHRVVKDDDGDNDVDDDADAVGATSVA